MGGIPDLDMDMRGKCSHCGEEFRTWDWIKHMQEIDGSGPMQANPAAVALGKLGGKVGGKSKSPAKQAASRANGKKHTAGKPEEPK